MANEKITEPVKYFIELHPTYLTWEGEWYSQTPKAEDSEDHTLGWKDDYNNFVAHLKRKQICSVEKTYNSKRSVWVVEMEVNGYPKSITVYFKKEKDAQSVFNTLHQYIFPKTIIEKIKQLCQKLTSFNFHTSQSTK